MSGEDEDSTDEDETDDEYEEAQDDGVDSDGDAEDEGLVDLKTYQKRQERLEAKDETEFIKNAELEDFIDENQLDDDAGHLQALLGLPKYITWAPTDLENEAYLRAGLHLLFNKINGHKYLHLNRSIHIRYLQFPKAVARQMEADHKITDKQIRMAQRHT